jgi:hypothetical protein
MFEGSFVALVTPFKDDESLDEAKLKELLEFDNTNFASNEARQSHRRRCCTHRDAILQQAESAGVIRTLHENR